VLGQQVHAAEAVRDARNAVEETLGAYRAQRGAVVLDAEALLAPAPESVATRTASLVIGQPAEQSRRGMRVHIDETWNDNWRLLRSF
jgi:hypothetical protein